MAKDRKKTQYGISICDILKSSNRGVPGYTVKLAAYAIGSNMHNAKREFTDREDILILCSIDPDYKIAKNSKRSIEAIRERRELLKSQNVSVKRPWKSYEDLLLVSKSTKLAHLTDEEIANFLNRSVFDIRLRRRYLKNK